MQALRKKIPAPPKFSEAASTRPSQEEVEGGLEFVAQDEILKVGVTITVIHS